MPAGTLRPSLVMRLAGEKAARFAPDRWPRFETREFAGRLHPIHPRSAANAPVQMAQVVRLIRGGKASIASENPAPHPGVRQQAQKWKKYEYCGVSENRCP